MKLPVTLLGRFLFVAFLGLQMAGILCAYTNNIFVLPTHHPMLPTDLYWYTVNTDGARIDSRVASGHVLAVEEFVPHPFWTNYKAERETYVSRCNFDVFLARRSTPPKSPYAQYRDTVLCNAAGLENDSLETAIEQYRSFTDNAWYNWYAYQAETYANAALYALSAWIILFGGAQIAKWIMRGQS